MTKEEEVVDGILQRGYDCFIKDGDIVITKDGQTTTTPIINYMSLLEPFIIETNNGPKEVQPNKPIDVITIFLHIHQSELDKRNGVEVVFSNLTLEDLIKNSKDL